MELLAGEHDNLRVRRQRRLAEVPQNHLTVTFRDPLPVPEDKIVERLLKIELRDRRYGSAVTTTADALSHFSQDFGVLVEQPELSQHLGVGRQRPAGHRVPHRQRVHQAAFREHCVLAHALIENCFGLQNLGDVQPQLVFGSPQGVPHGDNIRLRRAARHGRHGQVNSVGAGIQRRPVAQHRGARRFVRMHADGDLRPQLAAGRPDGFENRGWGCRARGVLVTQRVKLYTRSKNLIQTSCVEFRVVGAVRAWRQTHHRDADFVPQPVFLDHLAGVDQVVDVVEGVEIPYGGGAVLLEEFGVEFDDVRRLAVQTHHVDAAAQGLQVGRGARRLAHGIHHVKGALPAVEKQSLKTRPAAKFKMVEARRPRRLDRREKIFRYHPRAQAALKPIAERRVHDLDFLLNHRCSS